MEHRGEIRKPENQIPNKIIYVSNMSLKKADKESKRKDKGETRNLSNKYYMKSYKNLWRTEMYGLKGPTMWLVQ